MSKNQGLSSSMATELRGLARSLTRNEVAAQDLVQDAFVEMLELDNYDSVLQNVSAWLVTVIKNRFVDQFRRQKTEQNYAQDVELTFFSGQVETPEDSVLKEELKQVLFEAISRLPKEQRDVFVQNELEGRTFEEISKETGVSINTLLSRKRYAVLKLREELQEVYDEL